MMRRTKSTRLSATAVANTAFCTVLIAPKRAGAVFTSSKKLARSGCVPVLGVGPWKKI